MARFQWNASRGVRDLKIVVFAKSVHKARIKVMAGADAQHDWSEIASGELRDMIATNDPKLERSRHAFKRWLARAIDDEPENVQIDHTFFMDERD